MSATTPRRTVRRSDWRYAIAWTLKSRANALYVIFLMTAGGSLSALGLLRLQDPAARWSFAVVCWSVALLVVLRAPWRKKIGKGHETGDTGAVQ